MELKKNPKYDLTRKRGMFLNLGLTISVLIVILAFEWPNRANQEIIDLGSIDDDFEEIMEIPPTTQPPPPSMKVQIPEIIEVPDEEEIEEAIEMELDVEVTEETIIEDMVLEDTPEEKVDQIFTIVEELPQFPGGEGAFREFLSENIQYPDIAKRMEIERRVIVQFVVERDGTLTDITVAKGLGAGCDKETIKSHEIDAEIFSWQTARKTS